MSDICYAPLEVLISSTMEQLQKACEAREKIIIDRADFNEKVAALLKLCSYFWIPDDEDQDTNEADSLLFVQAAMPRDLESLEDAWNLGKDVVIIEKKDTWESVLSKFKYLCKVIESDQVLLSETRTNASYYVGSCSSDLEQGTSQIIHADWTPSEEDDESAEEDDGNRGEEDGWQLCRCFQLDSTTWSEKPKLQLPEAFQNTSSGKEQTISIQLSVHPLVKLDNFDHQVKLKTALLKVGVPTKQFIKEEFCLGYFADFIKLSFKPNWASVHPSLPTFQPELPICEGSMVKCSTNSSIGGEIGYKGFKLTGGKTWEKQWESVKESHGIKIVDEGEDGSIASFEWALLSWGGNGRRYRNTSTLLDGWRLYTKGREPPELPFNGGTGPRLQGKFPEITWVVPREALQGDSMSVEMRLQVRMQLLWFEKYSLFRSPRFSVQTWEHRTAMNFTIPSPILAI